MLNGAFKGKVFSNRVLNAVESSLERSVITDASVSLVSARKATCDFLGGRFRVVQDIKL